MKVYLNLNLNHQPQPPNHQNGSRLAVSQQQHEDLPQRRMTQALTG
jgi:hypothetical protein